MKKKIANRLLPGTLKIKSDFLKMTILMDSILKLKLILIKEQSFCLFRFFY